MDEGLAWQSIKWLLPWHYLLFVKCFFIWGSSFWLTSFWGCSLEFLSIITASANWGIVFDLEILTWLLLHTKLILQKIGFLVTVLLPSFSMQRCFFGFKRIFGLVYLLHYYFPKNVFERNYFFWNFHNLVTFSIFLCYLYFLFTDMTIVLVVAKKWLFSERFFLFF